MTTPPTIRDDELAALLAALFSTEGEARALLLRVGFPKIRLSQFVNAELFWAQTLEEARKGVLAHADRTLVRAALETMAAWMHEEIGRTRVGRDAVRAQLARESTERPRAAMDADALLQTLLDDSGLFVAWGSDEHGFSSLGLQEYLAARHLRARGLAQPELLRALAARFGDAWWHEVILMMLSLRGPSVFDEFMRAVTQRPELVRWVDSGLMKPCLPRPVRWSIVPFVELLVAMKDPNAFGLHDMHGNVWEWCRDAYGRYETSPRAGDGLRHAPDGAAKRVRRGGGFRALTEFARSAMRGHAYPDQRHDDLGLRPILPIRGSSWTGSSP
jgi:hypothetical protein